MKMSDIEKLFDAFQTEIELLKTRINGLDGNTKNLEMQNKVQRFEAIEKRLSDLENKMPLIGKELNTLRGNIKLVSEIKEVEKNDSGKKRIRERQGAEVPDAGAEEK